MTLMMASAKAASVPGRSRKNRSAFDAIQVMRGSTTTNLLPRLMQSTIQCPTLPSALLTSGLFPQTNITPGGFH